MYRPTYTDIYLYICIIDFHLRISYIIFNKKNKTTYKQNATTNSMELKMSKSNQSANIIDPFAKYAALSTKSAKIRAMYSDGMSRSQIAKALNIRYQHVRNVLTQPLKK